MLAAAQAVVDDTFLGYVLLSELQSAMDQFAEVTLAALQGKAALVFPMLVAECLACREPGLINTGIDFLVVDAAWSDAQVLQEALAVGQDPDCRGKVCGLLQDANVRACKAPAMSTGKAAITPDMQECKGRHVDAAAGGFGCSKICAMVCAQVLTAMESKFKNSKYSMMQARGVLTFDTESVPVQQFQARCADHILQAARHPVAKVGSQSPAPTWVKRMQLRSAALRTSHPCAKGLVLQGCGVSKSSSLWKR